MHSFEQFYVTLPSNASMDIYYDNTLSNFTTKLFQPLYFNYPYEVALVEIIYPVNFFLGKFTLVKLDSKHNTQSKGQPVIEKKISFDVNLNDISYNLLEYVNENLKKLAEKINLNVSIRIVYDNGSYNLIIPEGYFMIIIGEVADFFGFKANVPISNVQGEYRHASAWNEKSGWKEMKSNTLFVYTDIITHQYVGDSYKQLLRTVPISGKKTFDAITFSDPHYVSVSKNQIETIQISIKDDTNELVKFKSGIQKVIIKLHFRPKNSDNGV